MLELLKNERFSVFFTGIMLIICGVSFYWDAMRSNEIYWFQRSGALIVLAGVALQYSKITSLWKNATHPPRLANSDIDPMIPESARLVEGMNPVVKNTRDLALQTHEIIAGKSYKDSIAVLFIIVGTVIWAYGDIPFKS